MRISWRVERDGDMVVTRVRSEGIGDDIEAELKVDKEGFRIAEGVLRRKNGDKSLEELQGVEGYISGKREIRERLDRLDKYERYLILQCVSGLIQAETYLFRERGYLTEGEYEEYWNRLEKNGCRFYSDSRKEMRRSDPEWMSYVPDRFKEKILFEREKIYKHESDAAGEYVMGHLSDTFHEMKVKLRIGDAGDVKDMEIVFLRAPGRACFTNHENVANFRGENFLEIEKKDLIKYGGGCEGCYHIVEILEELQIFMKGSIA